MKQPNQCKSKIENLTVLYDETCGFCVRCMRWLRAQPVHVPLQYLAMHSPEALSRYAELSHLIVRRENFVVVSNNGQVYVGSHGRLMCLWALKEYRGLAQSLASPLFFPLVDNMFELVSRHRKRISSLFGLKAESARLGGIAKNCLSPCSPWLNNPNKLTTENSESTEVKIKSSKTSTI